MMSAPRGRAPRGRGTRRWVAACLLAGLVGGGCGGVGPEVGPLAEVERNRAKWDAARAASYEFGVERLCFCGQEARGPVRLSVSGQDVTERVYVDSGDLVPASFAELFPSVDGLFDILVAAIVADAHSIEVTYDTVSGVPIDLWIDYAENIADEELGFRVTEMVH